MLDDLKHLATEREPDKRLALLRSITDLYLDQVTPPSDSEEYLFGEIVTRVLRDMPDDHRVSYSERIAPSSRAPVNVLGTLAHDPQIAVAGPVLSQSPILPHVQLAEVASTGSDDHLQAIVRRASLPASLTDILIQRGSRIVRHGVTGHPRAEISRDSMSTLIGLARYDVTLGALLVDRPDLSPEAARKLAPLVSEALALQLSLRQARSPTRPQPTFEHQTAKRIADNLEAEEILAAIGTATIALGDALARLCDQKRIFDVALVIGKASGFQAAFVLQTLVSKDINLIMVLLRSLELDYSVLEGVLILRADRRCEPLNIPADLADRYDAIELAEAQRALRFLKVRMTTRF
ncbi:DUF2336 domain-containing protein [Phreatobacter aquaticus]|uniref:DUF2336 domain-containing protein n=1 Tax=Phreatobacter aquaticus TaxID=2570229 RepID=A0A4D7QQM2_9HYPH|nr:DUF2336 domain-containing protein [Phreatobacter aquaticus]QCK87197.1 DUF2336 domain-containing protein [Phreatobacter aquaticus]